MNDSSLASRRQRRRWLRSRGPRISSGSLFMIGLVIGMAAALYYAWIAEPVTFTEASPARLRDSYKEEYILLVSQSYAVDGDWEVAQDRLAALTEDNLAQLVVEILEEKLRSGGDSTELSRLAILARLVGAESPVVDVFAPPLTATVGALATPVSSTPTDDSESQLQTEAIRLPSRTPRPSPTPSPVPSPTQVPTYRLLKTEKICSTRGPIERIEVITVDSSLEQLPGVEILVSWQGGQDHFFTGFKPELGLGYGDITISPDYSYELVVAEGSQVVDEIRLEECDAMIGGQLGGWRLTFQNTDVIQDSPDQ